MVVGIAGGSGSGKTTLSDLILDRIGRVRIAYLPHDAYYRDHKELPIEERAKLNYDHPDSLETELLVEHIKQLKAGKALRCRSMTSPTTAARRPPSISNREQ